MVVNRVWAIGDVQAAQQDAAPQYHTLYLRVARTGQKGEQKLLPILHMFPGKLKTVIYYADTGVRRGGNVRAAGGHATGAARTARRKECGLEITLFYNSATHL